MLIQSLLDASCRIDVEEHVEFDEPREHKKEKVECKADESKLSI